MNWRELSTKIYAGVQALFLGLLALAFTPSQDWLDRSDHWKIDLNAEDAIVIEETHED